MNSALKGLAAEAVHVWRGERHVLRGVTLAVAPGELLRITGTNGAGKTTLLRVLCGLLRPEQGSVHWNGNAVREDPSAYQADLSYAAHEPALKADLTALENLRFAVGLRRVVSDQELREHLDRAGVGRCTELPVRILSAGQRRRVSIARIIAQRASLWLLDEPFTNLDKSGTALLTELLDEHLSDGGVALVAAHQQIGTSRRGAQLELPG